MRSLLTGLCIFFVSCVVATAQVTILPDSVRALIESKPMDSTMVSRINDIAHGYMKSDPFICRELATRAADLAMEVDFMKGHARSMNIKGSSYSAVGDYESALEYYRLAASEFTEINDEVGMALAYQDIGEVHKKLGDYRKAIRFMKTALEWEKKNNVNYALTLYNIGKAYFDREDYEDALIYFEDALNRSITEQNTRATGYAYRGLGELQQHMSNPEKALLYFEQAEEVWKKNGEVRGLIETYQEFSYTYMKLGNFDKSLEYITYAIELANRVGANDIQVGNYQQQSNVYQRAGDLKKAIEALRKRDNLKDSLYDVNRSQQIAALQVAFETDARLIENQQLKATSALQDARLRAQSFMIIAISGGLLVVGLLAILFFNQRKKTSVANSLLRDKSSEINEQKDEIEFQARALKNLNQELQDLNKSLETRIEERTHQLWWKNQKLADYAHTNSHKLRAPVASILGLIQLMEKIDLPKEDRVLLEKLLICAHDLDKITRDINSNLEQDPELADAVIKEQRSITINR